jgi:periplasmic protein CpxP/Spy
MLRYVRKIGMTWALVGTLLAGLFMASPVLAQQTGGSRGSLLTPEDRAAMAQIFWHRTQATMGLSEQQATEIRALLDAQRATMRTNFQGLMAARTQLRSLLAEPTPDPTAVQAVAAQIKSQQAALFDARLQTQLALRAKLTPEQWQQWQSLRQGRGQRGMHRAPGFGRGM